MHNPIYVYKSLRNIDMYLYIIKKDDFSHVPKKLLEKFGNPIFVLSFDLNNRQKLGKENPAIVQHNLEKQGYHLQLPDLHPGQSPLNMVH